MRTLKEQAVTCRRAIWDDYCALVPCFADIMTGRSEEEWELQRLPLHAVLFHVWVMVKAGVVYSSYPACLSIRNIALQALWHGTGQENPVVHVLVCPETP